MLVFVFGRGVFYTFQGNTQWLMNGGFLDQSRPCDDLLVTPADVVPRFWESAEVCLDQCYLPSKWEVF